MSTPTPARIGHSDLCRTLQDIYRSNGKPDPYLANFFNTILEVSYWHALGSPSSPAAPQEKTDA
jgi:hypothetical protein